MRNTYAYFRTVVIFGRYYKNQSGMGWVRPIARYVYRETSRLILMYLCLVHTVKTALMEGFTKDVKKDANHWTACIARRAFLYVLDVFGNVWKGIWLTVVWVSHFRNIANIPVTWFLCCRRTKHSWIWLCKVSVSNKNWQVMPRMNIVFELQTESMKGATKMFKRWVALSSEG